MNKDGFIATSIIYTFLIVFIFINTSLIVNYINKNNYLDEVNNHVQEDVILDYVE